MDARTIDFATDTLKNQYKHYLDSKDIVQGAYFEGMFAMFEILISEGYTDTLQFVKICEEYELNNIKHVFDNREKGKNQ